MKILAIDTSTEYMSIAVTDGKRVIVKFHKKTPMSHSRLLMPMIDKTLKKARVRLSGIGCFAIGIGPGSFTGLRIGVATVKGLAFSTGKPIVAVPTLDVIAHNVKGFRGIICPVLDARKNKVYSCLYKSDGKSIKRISRYLLLPLAELLGKTQKYDNLLFLGDAAYLVGDGYKKLSWHPRAEIVAALGMEAFKKKRFVSAEDLEPMYLYSKECDIKGI